MAEALTPAAAKALKIVRRVNAEADHGTNGKAFAWLMWPDSPGWEKRSPAGDRGSRKGCGMWRAAGSYLAKLRQRGLVYYGRGDGYWLTAAGRAALDAYEERGDG